MITMRSRPRTSDSSSALRAALVLLLLASSGCQSVASDTVVLEPATGKPVPVAVELATTPDARQLGLMYRESLDPGRGMLFIFPRSAPQSFWMRNTKIPLDIVFIDDAGKIVRLHARTTPFSEDSLPSGAPVRFVLEVPGGYCEQNGVHEGDTVRLGSLATHPAR
jgi:uncharacterized membrane protein (UPF0127 family)